MATRSEEDAGASRVVLEARAVEHSYEDVKVLGSIDLMVGKGEAVCVMAPSGAGKSTLLRVLLGLEPPCRGHAACRVPRTEVGAVFQEDNLLPWLNVTENARLLNDLTGKPIDRERLERCMEQLDLVEFRAHLPRALSTGMKQKVAVCRLLSYAPTLHVIDEGLANMDDWTRFLVCDLVRESALGSGGTLLVVTHNPTDALHMADKIILGTGRPLSLESRFENPLPRDRDVSVRFTPEFRDALERLRDVQNDLRS